MTCKMKLTCYSEIKNITNINISFQRPIKPKVNAFKL